MLERINALIDVDVTDVLISASNGVWVQRDGSAERAALTLTEQQARRLAIELIDLGDRHIDDATPCVDVRLDGGVRVHAVLAPVSVGGTEISIRIPNARALALSEMVTRGEMSRALEVFLGEAISAKLTFLISGSAGAGKTTLLGALMSAVPDGERLISIEDVAELRIEHPRRVSLEARQANTEGRGAISIADLIATALRMRPDRLIVGECRGAETIDMLRAFTTGHAGGGSTIHANSLEDTATRLDSLGALAGMPSTALARLACAAIDLVVHIDRTEAGRRVSVGRLRVDGGVLAVHQIALD
jgi:pilus assembly protein CpaF